MRKAVRFVCGAVVLSLWAPVRVPAGDWLQWRGPALNGTAPARDLPQSWSMEDGRNLAWVTDLPGYGNSTPGVAGERIFLSLTAGEAHELHALCLDRASGKILWQHQLGASDRTARDNTMASPSAVTDGESVWFLFGQGTLAAYSVDGTARWTRELEQDYNVFTHKYGYSSSPLLYDGTLYIPVLRRLEVVPPLESNGKPLPSYLLAVDAATGETRFAHERPTEAVFESLDAYITPILHAGADGPEVVLSGGDLVTGHDPHSGRRLWQHDWAVGNRIRNWRLIASPVAAGPLVVAPMPRGGTLTGVRPPETGLDAQRVWTYEGYSPDVCTPAYQDGLLYLLDGKKRYLTCLEAADGAVVWQEKLESREGFYASPTVADGRIYIVDLGGTVSVWAAGRKAERLAEFSIGNERCAASIVAVDGSLLLRTPTRLICVRKP